VFEQDRTQDPWHSHVGEYHHLVDRNDRRDLSIFQIGLRFTERMLTNGSSVTVPLFNYL
jgi:hypothetical protein